MATPYSDKELNSLAVRVGTHLLAARRRVATAESCTGGWIAKALTDIPGSSQWFETGYVTYADRAKTVMLRVLPAMLAAHGSVSEPVVRSMAESALTDAGADIAVAVSGIAGPDGGTPAKPVGTVWFAWTVRHGKSVRTEARMRLFKGDREAIRRKAVAAALTGLLER